MPGADAGSAREIRDRAREAQQPRPRASRERPPTHRFLEQMPPRGIGGAPALHFQIGETRIAAPLALQLHAARERNACGRGRRALAPVCGGVEFYARKDFDPKIGLTVVIIGALISAVFYWFGRDLIAYGILGSAALIDLVVYGRLGDLTVCYRCHSEFRGEYRRSAGAFDLHTADVLEQEYERRIRRR